VCFKQGLFLSGRPIFNALRGFLFWFLFFSADRFPIIGLTLLRLHPFLCYPTSFFRICPPDSRCIFLSEAYPISPPNRDFSATLTFLSGVSYLLFPSFSFHRVRAGRSQASKWDRCGSLSYFCFPLREISFFVSRSSVYDDSLFGHLPGLPPSRREISSSAFIP